MSEFEYVVILATDLGDIQECFEWRNADGLTEEQVEPIKAMVKLMGESGYTALKQHKIYLERAFPATFAKPEKQGQLSEGQVDRWERTGEHRVPKPGEWYEDRTGAKPSNCDVKRDRFGPRWILKEVTDDSAK